MTKYNIIVTKKDMEIVINPSSSKLIDNINYQSKILSKQIIIKIFENKEEGLYFQAMDGNKDIGLIHAQIYGNIAHIHYFEVDEQLRNKGIGNEIYSEIEYYLTHDYDEEIVDITIESHPKAINFWNRLGFVKENPEDEPIDYIPMIKSIEDDKKSKMVKKNSDKCEFEAIGDKLVDFNISIPKSADKFIKVPYVPNGFENSCSECSAEMILRNFGVVGWSQFEIHSRGYQTFEGGISEGDYGIKNMFLYERFCDKNGNIIKFHVEEKNNGTIDDLKKLIDKNIPIIVRIFTDIQKVNKHTFVIIGYNNKGVYKHDNDLGRSLFIPNMIFKSQWSKNYFIIYPI